MIVEILKELDVGDFKIKINHKFFLQAIVQLGGCGDYDFKKICSSLDKLDKKSWEQVKDELMKSQGLSEKAVNGLTDEVHFTKCGIYAVGGSGIFPEDQGITMAGSIFEIHADLHGLGKSRGTKQQQQAEGEVGSFHCYSGI